MQVSETRLSGPRLLEPTVHGDSRGFFLESYRVDVLADAGLSIDFIQDNHSRSSRAVVRGMHFQPGQVKLVRCPRGAIIDVICDIRVGSPTFGQWEAFELNDESHHQLLVPNGFAHGFVVVSEVADVVYKVSSYYDPSSEAGFRFDDPIVAIDWPLSMDELQFSARDQSAPTLAELEPALPFRYDAADQLK